VTIVAKHAEILAAKEKAAKKPKSRLNTLMGSSQYTAWRTKRAIGVME